MSNRRDIPLGNKNSDIPRGNKNSDIPRGNKNSGKQETLDLTMGEYYKKQCKKFYTNKRQTRTEAHTWVCGYYTLNVCPGMKPLITRIMGGFDLSELDKLNNNILHTAARVNSVMMFKCALTWAKISLEVRGFDGHTYIMAAANHGSFDVFHLLRLARCDVTLIDSYKNNILHLATLGGSVKIIKEIIDLNQFDINRASGNSYTPLMMTEVYPHHLDAFKYVLKQGADVSIRTNMGETILMIAIQYHNTEIVSYILAMNLVDINAVNSEGKTAMMVAAFNKEETSFRLLYEQGAKARGKDNKGNTVVSLACQTGSRTFFKFVSERVEVKSKKDTNCHSLKYNGGKLSRIYCLHSKLHYVC